MGGGEPQMAFQLEMVPEGETGLRFVRHFAAPLPKVWRAFTEPGLLMQWMWTEEHRMTHCEQEFRTGGDFRWCWAMSGGGSSGLTGRFVEIVPETRIVQTEVFDDDWAGGETRVTTSFRAEGDEAVVEMLVEYPSAGVRDRAAASPMAAGMEQGYARLANLLPGWGDCVEAEETTA